MAPKTDSSDVNRLPCLKAWMAKEEGMMNGSKGNKTRKPQIDRDCGTVFLRALDACGTTPTNYLQNKDRNSLSTQQRYDPELNHKSIFLGSFGGELSTNNSNI